MFDGDIADVMALGMWDRASFVKVPSYVTPATGVLFLSLLYHSSLVEGVFIHLLLSFHYLQELVVINDVWVMTRNIWVLRLTNSVELRSEFSLLVQFIYLLFHLRFCPSCNQSLFAPLQVLQELFVQRLSLLLDVHQGFTHFVKQRGARSDDQELGVEGAELYNLCHDQGIAHLIEGLG